MNVLSYLWFLMPLLPYLIRFTNKISSWLPTSKVEKEDNFSIVGGGKVCKIKIIRNGVESNIYLPYDSTRYDMLNKKVYLVKEGITNKPVRFDITHEVGIPYLASASELNGDKFIVEDLLMDTSKSYQVLPKYLE